MSRIAPWPKGPRVFGWALIGVLGAASARCEDATLKPPLPDLKAVDDIFGELESLGGILERCIDEKASAASRGQVLLREPPELSTAGFKSESQALSPEQRQSREEGLKAAAACRAGFRMNLRDKELARFFWTDSNDELQAYHWACLALARRDLAVCSELEQAGFKNVARECRIIWTGLSLVRALASGDPRASKLCLDAAAAPGQDVVSSTQACAALVGRGDPAEICPQSAFEGRYFRKPECVMALGLFGKTDACSAFEPIWHGWEERACRDYAAYVKARAARDAGLCGEGPLCHALMAEGVSGCQALSAMIRDRFCMRLVPSFDPVPAVSTSAVTPASDQKLRQTKIKLSELAREQERVAMEEKRRTMREELAALAEVRRVEPLRKFQEISAACLKTAKDIQDKIDSAYAFLTAFEPKGHAGHKGRVEKFFEAQGLQAQRVKRLQAIKAP